MGPRAQRMVHNEGCTGNLIPDPALRQAQSVPSLSRDGQRIPEVFMRQAFTGCGTALVTPFNVNCLYPAAHVRDRSRRKPRLPMRPRHISEIFSD